MLQSKKSLEHFPDVMMGWLSSEGTCGSITGLPLENSFAIRPSAQATRDAFTEPRESILRKCRRPFDGFMFLFHLDRSLAYRLAHTLLEFTS